MAETVISGLIEGGKASGGPPFGPALGPLGVNIGKVVEEINEKTKGFAGMKIPVKVIVDTSTKEYRVEAGAPPISALILKEAGAEKGAKEKGEKVGNITIEQAKKVAQAKDEKIYGKSLADKVKQVIGTCKSIGVTVEGKDPREAIRQIDAGEIKI